MLSLLEVDEMTNAHSEQLLTGLGLREYFHDAVHSALVNQHISASDETVIYVVNLLTVNLHSECLFEHSSDGLTIKPLALIYGEALDAQSEDDRDNTLQRLGDIALFISGLFANSLSRSLVDVDYYIAMGGSAYSYLADSSRVSRNHTAFKLVFDELSDQFGEFVDLLAEVSEHANLTSSADIMRLYEIWQSTGSKHASNKLQKLGIHPIQSRRLTH